MAARAAGALKDLAADLPYADPEDREALRAGIDFERWLLESCLTALPPSDRARSDPF